VPVTHRKKPVSIEAHQLREDAANASEIAAWCGGTVRNALARPTDADSLTRYVDIVTLEGTMTASPGDWVIRGVQGEFYPCKPDIFASTYDEIVQTPGMPNPEEQQS
jgi:hypothetical protein